MEKDKETVTVEEEGFSLELPAPSGWKKKVPFWILSLCFLFLVFFCLFKVWFFLGYLCVLVFNLANLDLIANWVSLDFVKFWGFGVEFGN